MNDPRTAARLDTIDRRLVLATQAGLPLTPRPYALIAESVGIDPREAMQRIQRMLDAGIIRRIGAVPNHYALGYRANGMTVWDLPDERVDELGRKIAALPFVSHCYRRPRRLAQWPYNLFAMVHGRARSEVEAKVLQIMQVIGDDCGAHEVLYSTRILKKTGLRLDATKPADASASAGTQTISGVRACSD